MTFQFIVFVFIGLIILLGAHWVLYFSLVRFFVIIDIVFKNYLVLILGFLAVSFFLASLWARFQDNWFSRSFYFVSGFWLGLLLNLLMAISLAWLFLLIKNLSNLNINFEIIAALLIILAVGYSICGSFNAFQPRIKTIQVHLKNLPAEWQNKKIIQISDVHLGYIYRAEFLQKIVEQANAVKPDLIFITGDLFDGMGGQLSSLAEPLKNLKAVRGIFFVTGNHENYLGKEKVFSFLEEFTNVKILKDEMVRIDGLQIIGLNYPDKEFSKIVGKAVSSIKDFNPEQASILLYHPPLEIKEAKELGISLQLSGHTHKGQLFPLGFITKLVYHGYDYGLHQINDFYIYTTSGLGTWGPPMRTNNNPEMVVIELQ